MKRIGTAPWSQKYPHINYMKFDRPYLHIYIHYIQFIYIQNKYTDKNSIVATGYVA